MPGIQLPGGRRVFDKDAPDRFANRTLSSKPTPVQPPKTPEPAPKPELPPVKSSWPISLLICFALEGEAKPLRQRLAPSADYRITVTGMGQENAKEGFFENTSGSTSLAGYYLRAGGRIGLRAASQ